MNFHLLGEALYHIQLEQSSFGGSKPFNIHPLSSLH